MSVTDDEVLRAMSAFGLDAEDLDCFRYFRNLMESEIPVCCIAFTFCYANHVPNMSHARMDAILCDESSRGAKLNAAVAKLVDFQYYCNACDVAGRNLNYTPCPACVLTKRFVDVSPTCACCADKSKYPAP